MKNDILGSYYICHDIHHRIKELCPKMYESIPNGRISLQDFMQLCSYFWIKVLEQERYRGAHAYLMLRTIIFNLIHVFGGTPSCEQIGLNYPDLKKWSCQLCCLGFSEFVVVDWLECYVPMHMYSMVCRKIINEFIDKCKNDPLHTRHDYQNIILATEQYDARQMTKFKITDKYPSIVKLMNSVEYLQCITKYEIMRHKALPTRPHFPTCVQTKMENSNLRSVMEEVD